MLHQCAVHLANNGSLYAVFLTAGLTGGFSHCLGMCGPIVAAESSCKTACNGCSSKSDTLARASQFSYHLGRMLTYGILGFTAALFSTSVEKYTFWPYLSAAMLVGAGLLFILSSIPACRHKFFSASRKLTFTRGAMLGFMPCGLIYAMLMLAASTASPLKGLLAMWIFVLGTVPALLIASAGTAFMAQKWQAATLRYGRALMVFNGLSLFVMAGKLVRI